MVESVIGLIGVHGVMRSQSSRVIPSRHCRKYVNLSGPWVRESLVVWQTSRNSRIQRQIVSSVVVVKQWDRKFAFFL